MTLNELNAIISGGSQGLGLEVAKHFILAGANVLICARNKTQLIEAKKYLTPFAQNNKILIKQTDISQPKQVDALMDTAQTELGEIDILVANAAVYGTKGMVDEINWQEWSDTIDINLKGTVLQCRAVLPHFKKNRKGKIIILSGGGATKPMPYLSAYAASKAAVVRFAETLACEVQEFNIDVNAVAPGALNTRFLDEILAAGPEKVGEHFYQQAIRQYQEGGTPLSMGAELCTFLASSESNGITGKLISAVWDPWKKLPKYIDELKSSDIFTLRRIIPEERGKTWDT